MKEGKTLAIIVGLCLMLAVLISCAKPTSAPAPTSTSVATNIVTKFNASYGVAPASGWKWGVAEITTGAEERTEGTNRHGFAWIFYVVRGSTEIGTTDGKKVISSGEGVMVPAQQDHTHRFLPQSQVLVFRPTDRPFGDFHQGNRLWESDAPLALNAGQNYSTRIREYTLAPGVANLTAEGHWGYVLEGTLTLRAGGTASTQQAGKVFGLTSNANQVLSNEGTTPTRFIVVGLH